MDKADFRFYGLVLVALVLIPSVVGVFGLLGGVSGQDLLHAIYGAFGSVLVAAFFIGVFFL